MSQQTQSRFTPGPWHVTECLDYWVQAGEVGVAHCGDVDWGDDDSNCVRDQATQEANARLIAAAPELLTELQNLVAICAIYAPHHDLAIERGKAAIAKATGQ